MRDIALAALAKKRGNTHGAAFFAVLPSVRSRPLVRLLIAYQVLWDYLDSLSEAMEGMSETEVVRLHLALVDALDPTAPERDYYGRGPNTVDAGYLHALIEVCRKSCEALPSFHKVQFLLRQEAHRIGVQAVNHNQQPMQRGLILRNWVTREYPGIHEATWFEFAAAAGANLAIYALLALASEAHCASDEIGETYRAYFPWSGALATMLDSFVDQHEDEQRREHRYILYYKSTHSAEQHLCRLLERSLLETHRLNNPERHTLVTAAMVAMYLSRDSARIPPLRGSSGQIADAGGSLTNALLPVLRLWRIATNSRAT